MCFALISRSSRVTLSPVEVIRIELTILVLRNAAVLIVILQTATRFLSGLKFKVGRQNYLNYLTKACSYLPVLKDMSVGRLNFVTLQ